MPSFARPHVNLMPTNRTGFVGVSKSMTRTAVRFPSDLVFGPVNLTKCQRVGMAKRVTPESSRAVYRNPISRLAFYKEVVMNP